MSSTLYPILQEKNAHPRDEFILFDEPTHKYTITTDPDSTYTSVTTWNHTHFAKFDADKIIEKMMTGKNWNPENKYWGLTQQDIKDLWKKNADDVSSSGTNMHYEIECFMNQIEMKNKTYTHQTLLENYLQKRDPIETFESPEWKYFLQFVEENPHMRPYRTEWMIYDEDIKLSGSIDMVYENDDGTLSIYDWKRAKEITKTNKFNKYATRQCIHHIPDTNFWHYALQLNTYKTILERKYGRVVKELFLVRLHPDATEETYELISVPILLTEMNALLEQRLETVSAN
jgi:ATP-dependent exoDNAse (exonuclease V) beta subunit